MLKEPDKKAFKQDLLELLEKHFGRKEEMLETEISKMFWETYITMTRLLKRDIVQEVKPPQIVKLEIIEDKPIDKNAKSI